MYLVPLIVLLALTSPIFGADGADGNAGTPASEALFRAGDELFFKKKDYAGALDLYQKAAAAGALRAYHNMGLIYSTRLKEPDHAKAVASYLRAAEKGYAPAQNSLGLLYQTGRGVPVDPVKAEIGRAHV